MFFLWPFLKSVMWFYVFDGSDGGRSGSGSAFIGGFVLGGLIIGTLGCVYAPQVMILKTIVRIIIPAVIKI